MLAGNRSSHMDLGVVHYASFPQTVRGEGPILETLERILLDDFFTAVEVTWIRDDVVKRRVAEILAYANMQVVFSGGPPYAFENINLSALDDADWERSLVKAKSLVDDAYALGARIHVVASGPDTAPGHRDQAKDRLVDALAPLCDYALAQATDYSLTLCLEPIDRTVHRRGLIGPIKEAVQVAERVAQRGGCLGLTVDQSHLAQLGERPEEAIAMAGDSLIHLHLANCLLSDPTSPIYGDEHPRFGAPGSEHDVPEIAAFFQVLQAEDFFERQLPYGEKPIVSIEVKPQEQENPDIVLAATKRAIEAAWNSFAQSA